MYVAIKKHFRSFGVLYFLIFYTSCQNKSVTLIDNEAYAVLGVIINSLDIPTPPPPPAYSTDTEVEDFTDSIVKIYSSKDFKRDSIRIAIDTIFNLYYKRIWLDSAYKKDYQPLLDSLLSINEIRRLEISKIPVKKNINLIVAPNNEKLLQKESGRILK